MTKIAFLGLGAMGSRMASRLLQAGYAVTVWNRSIAATHALAAAGASAADTPRDAATDADIVLAMVRDDDASDAVWLDDRAGALKGLKKGAVAVDCSTLSVGHVRRLATVFQSADRAFLDAPVAGSRPQAEAGALIFFAGGDAAMLDRIHPVLDTLGGAIHHAGPVGSGAVVKLMVNALFGAQLAMMAELIGFADRSGVDPLRAVEIVGSTPVCGPAAKMSAEAMIAGRFAPAFPIDLVVKDFGLIASSAAEAGAEMPLSAAAADLYRHAVRAGFEADNITGIVQLYGPASQRAV